ncbi:hypothetical protein HII31_12245 [Pseudocercospora fuligena]|uniref:Heterokaryon incompatibility domain-containing protein n=1 Tax=Pseudocercospora fuligena TaxID=685502 RepID=A0A8H6VFQ2_9PEZI|nr:hypothetical protein HII31_12245 [Pseudocercospora fuligena]
MDHIPNENGRGLNIRVPYYAQELYFEGGDWETYPERAGYPWLCGQLTVQELNAQYQHVSDNDLRAFAQCWMFFAVLGKVLGPKNYSRQDFLVQNDQTGLWEITTSSAQVWMLRGNDRRPILGRPGMFDFRINTDNLVPFLNVVNKKAVLWDRFAAGKDDSWTDLAISFKVLIELLSTLPKHIARVDNNPSTLDIAAQPGPALDRIRTRLLQESGTWCPHQIEALCSTLSYSALIYLTGLTRMQRDTVDHTSCREQKSCVAYNTNLGVRVGSAHVDDKCACEHLQAPRKQRVRILARGGIAVLRCSKDRHGNIKLRFVPASPDLQYAAISHVWADGLGNTFENSIPRCQVLRLLKAVNAVSESRYPDYPGSVTVHFWLDVYCVPAQVSQSRIIDDDDRRSEQERQQDIELKKKAIARMDATYAWAEYVLVLDHELSKMVTLEWDPQVAMAQDKRGPQVAGTKSIACMAISAWNTRCWTYQEHAFARSTVLQGIGCQSHFDSLKTTNAVETTLQYDFMRLAGRHAMIGGGVQEYGLHYRQYANSENRSKSDASIKKSSFGSAWNIFSGRNTTQWKDMIVILANMLDLSAAAILQLESDMQMKAILASHGTLPISLLFVEMDRLGHGTTSHSEDRWIPTMPQSVYLPCSEAGDLIDVTASGLLLKPTELHSGAIWVLEVPLINDEMPDSCSVPVEQDRHSFWLSIPQNELRHCIERLPFRPTSALILLDRSDPLLEIDDTASFRGACLLPVGQHSENAQATIFVSPLTWGQRAVSNDNEAVLASKVVTDVLITSDIASWPKLPPSRARKLRSVKIIRIIIVGVNMSLAVLGVMLGFLLTSGGDTSNANKFFEVIRPHVEQTCEDLGTVNGVQNLLCTLQKEGSYGLKVKPAGAVLLASIAGLIFGYWLTFVVKYALLLLLMYGVHSEIDARRSWWRQLHGIFKLLVLREIRWWRWPEYLVLRLVVTCIATPVLLCEGVWKLRRKAGKSEDMELQESLVEDAQR